MLSLLLSCAIAASPQPIPVDPMTSTAAWALAGQRVCYSLGQSKLEVQPSVPPGAAGSLALSYDLDRRHWIGLQWRGPAILGRPTALRLWVEGDASKHRLNARLEDAQGRYFNVPLGALDFRAWRPLDVPMDPARWTPVLRHEEQKLPVRWPVALRELRVTKDPAGPLLGRVAFARLEAQGVVAPIDRLQIAIACDAPANVCYPPQSLTLRATFTNPTAQPLSGRLDTVACDWLDRPHVADHGPLLLPPGTTQREISVSLSQLGAYRLWVRFTSGGASREASTRVAVSRKAVEPPKLDPQSPLGMGLYLPRFNEAQLPLAIRLAREAGVKWARDGLSLNWIATAPGRFAWDTIRWTDALHGQAVLVSAGQSLTVESSPSLNRPCQSGEFTLAMRIKFLRFDYPERWRTLLGKGEGPQRQWHFYLTVPRREIGVSFGDGQNAWSDIACTKTDWQTDRWYDLLLVHRRADRAVRWWVDGTPAGSGKTRSNHSLVATDLPMRIGPGADFALDDLAIYDRALQPGQLKTASAVARWNFDEGRGRSAADASGNANTAASKPFRSDEIFRQAAAAGISTYALLMGTPAWMASRPAEGLPRPWNIMPRAELWAQVVEAAARRYAAQGIHVWEIWNEPNIEPFWTPQPDPAEYVQVLKASYAAIKRADPQAVVLGCALAGPHGPDQRPPYEFVESVLKLGGARSMDAISIHPYRQPRSPEDSQYLQDLQAIGDLTARYGPRLPIWISEVGWPNDPAGSSEAWAAKMLPRAYLLALAAGVRNVAWYDYHDDGPDATYLEHNCGLLAHDLTPKPPYFAFRTLATELAGMQFERQLALGDGVTVLLFRNGQHRTAAAWSHRGTCQIAFRTPGRAELESVDMMGNTRRQPVRDGGLLLELDESTLYLRNVTAHFEALRPIEAQPAVLKVLPGETARATVTLRNPSAVPQTLEAGSHRVTLPARGEKRLDLEVTHAAAAAGQLPPWRNADRSLLLRTPCRTVPLAGRRSPLFQHSPKTSRATSTPHQPHFDATDEVTLACRVRCDGPTGTWPTMVAKWQGEQSRNYGLYLGKDKGELCFSASYEKGQSAFQDFQAGQTLFDGRWHRVAVTYSAHDQLVCFYVDGQPVKRHTHDGGLLRTNRAPLRLAAGFEQAGKARGAVSDVQAWNRALQPAEIAGLAAPPATSSTRPNFLIILCDNLGYGDVGCFGSTKNRTPHLDRMAAEGLRLTSFCVTSGVCTPSRASLMTGCYPRRVNLEMNPRRGPVLQPLDRKGLAPSEVTIAETLRAAGYATACIGKWHLGDQLPFLPTRQGFDEFFGIPYSDDMTARVVAGVSWPELPLMRGETVVEAPVDRHTLTRRYTEETIRFITAHQDRPWLVYLPQAMPGSTDRPFAGQPFRDRSSNGAYGDSIEELDWSTGEILAALKRLGLDRQTLVVWTSDNGSVDRQHGSNRPLSGWGYTTMEGAMRVPCIVRWPGRVPAGASCSELCTTMDLLPTLARLAGAAPPADRPIDGHDIRPLLLGEPGARSPYPAFYYYYMEQLQAVRSGRWKLHLPLAAKWHNFRGTDARPSPAELYDLEADVGETKNLASTQPEVVARLMALAEQARADLGDLGRPGKNQRSAGWVDTPQPQLMKGKP